MRIPVGEPLLGEEERQNVMEAVTSGLISSKVGRFGAEFEGKFARYLGVNHAITMANGTAALHLALLALGIGEGDEVIVPTLTFIATANAVTYTGAKPVFVDSHPDHWSLDHERLEMAITPRTRAIIPVHLFGHPCDMDPIMEISRRHNLYVIEDVAEAPGAEYRGRKVGSFSDVACFSFFGNKIISTGEGGMCTTQDAALAQRLNLLKDQGMDPQNHYWHDVVGFNYRMSNIQAAIGTAQIDKLDAFIEVRRSIADTYRSLLKEVKGLVLPPEMPWARHVFWMYSILIEEVGLSRDQVIDQLADRGIEAKPFFYPLHTMPPYADGRALPVAEAVARKGICLPCSAKLSHQDVEYIAQTLKEILGAPAGV